MTTEERARLQASVRQRLLNLAQRDNTDFQFVLTRYGLERFLYRLGRSPHRSTFLLKGAFLFYAWQHEMGRPTRDLDLLGHGVPDIRRLEGVIADIAAVEADDDGLDFVPDTIRGEAIREASLYDGIRLKLVATLGRIRIPMQIDIGFGDAAGPSAVELEYPTLLDQDAPRILTYRPEFVVAEKPGLADEFADDSRTRMWNAFIARNGLDAGRASLVDVVRELRSHYWPLIHAAGHAG